MKYQDWQILNRYPNDPAVSILEKRGIKDVDRFFNVRYEDLPRPSDFPGLLTAKKLIYECREKEEMVGVFMDYDADGLCGGAIINQSLNYLKIKNIAYVPRREEGYGLSNSAVDFFYNAGVKVIICVDCGIRNTKEIDYATEKGIKTIVVDHHQIGEDLPKAAAIVHPLVKKNNRLKFKEYSGGGVAYLLARELYQESGREKWLLDLAAISSIADVVPAIEANRVIIKYGLHVLSKSRNIGLKELMRSAGLEMKSVGTYEVGFLIAPRINAAGRVSNPRRSFELLSGTNEKIVKKAAEDLESLNLERQKILEETQIEATKIIEKNKLYKNKIIVIKKPNWNEGIIGLVASRMVEKFYRPTIVLCDRKDFVRGSARSIPGINIYDLISKNKEDLLSFGGHAQAAGLSVRKEGFEHFVKKITANASVFDDALFDRTLRVDAMINLNQITKALSQNIEKMEPFGPSNPKPVFATEGVQIKNIKKMGKDLNHCRFFACVKSDQKSCVAFKFDENGFDLSESAVVDIAFTIKKSYWQGNEKIDLIVEDVKKKK